MEKKTVDIGSPVNVAGVTLIPLSEVHIDKRQSRYGFLCYGNKSPTSVIVITPAGKKAFSISGEKIRLSRIIRENPALGKILEAI